MKKIILIIFLIAGLYSTEATAQEDSVQTAHPSEEFRPAKKPDAAPATGSQPQLPPDQNVRSTDPLIRIRMDAVPLPMRKNLESAEYRGWEQSEIYQNTKTQEYLIDIRSGDSIRTFRFDRAGFPIEPLSID